MLLIAIGGFFGLSDFGISSAFQNDVTVAEARGETARLRSMFLTAQATLFALALIAAVVMTVAAVTVGRTTFFRSLSPELANRAGFYTLIFVVVGACNVPLALSGKLAFGLHRGYLANLVSVAGQILTVAALAVATWRRAPFEIFLLAATVPTVAGNLILSIWLYRQLEPSDGGLLAGFSYAKHTVVSGFPFLAMGASWPCFSAVGPLLLSAAFGPSVVAAYSLVVRALGVVHNMQSGLLGALWPALTEALARKDYGWAWHSIRRSVSFSVGLFCLPILLFPFVGPLILSFWSRLPVESFPTWMTWPLTLLYAALFFQGPFCVALHAAGSVTLLAASFFAAALATLALAAFLRQTPELVPTCLAAAFGALGLIPPIVQTARIYRPKLTA
jgi:O-antigen/teichoic acid export membrane protein